MGADRNHSYWTEDEDRALLAYKPHQGETLRDVAARLGRSYYACRHRRKELLAGRIKPGERRPCVRCDGELPEGRKHGFCDECSSDAYRAAQRRSYHRQREAALPFAANLGVHWSPEDEAVLMAGGQATVQLARKLGRTPAACVTHRAVVRSRSVNGHGPA